MANHKKESQERSKVSVWSVRVLLAAVLTLAATTFPDAQDLDDLAADMARMRARIQALENRVADVEAALACGDEYEQALALTTIYGYETGVPFLWDGTPFVVDVAQAFSNADELLEAVEVEATRVKTALGFEVFVAGEVLPLRQLTYAQFYDLDTLDPNAEQLTPQDQHIEFYCCYVDPDRAYDAPGVAYQWRRVAMLQRDAFQARHVILHELYHVLGFGHADDDFGVPMSDVLMYGPGIDASGTSLPTRAAPADLAKLGCIYND